MHKAILLLRWNNIDLVNGHNREPPQLEPVPAVQP